MAVDHNAPAPPLFLGALYSEEEEESRSEITSLEVEQNPLLLHEFDDSCCRDDDDDDDDEHLQSLLFKERETSLRCTNFAPCVLIARKQAVEIILRIRLFHGFSASAAVLAVNFLDRFLFYFWRAGNEDKPWLMQLVAVACLSLAAKVEETHVPLLLDLQGEDAEYLFESKTVQRMELLILSALEWRMNAVTPISFIDHIVRRLGLKSDVILLEFIRSCENTILSLISDSRIVGYFPSVVATATMLNVVHRQDEFYGGVNATKYKNTMFAVLKTSKKEVEECYKLISDDVVSRLKIWELSSDSSSSSSSSLPLSRKQDLTRS